MTYKRAYRRRGALAARLCVVFGLLHIAAPSALSDTEIKDLFRKVTNSVVVVQTLERLVVDGRMPREQVISDLGSGVLISADGLIITAAHLVQAADRVLVRFAGGDSVPANVIASEPTADIALIRLEMVPESATVAPLGDSRQVAIGDRIIVVGAPYGLEHSLSVGYISARHDPTTLEGPLHLGEVFQTDAAINRGNSGGPMFNSDGEVIGIVSYILSRTGAFEGVGFAVTSNTVRDMLLERTGFWSGMTVFALSPVQARALNLPRTYGVMVQRIARGSIASQIGLRPGFLPSVLGDREIVLGGDVILSVDGIPVGSDQDHDELRDHLAGLSVGQEVTVELFRRGALVSRTFEISEGWLHGGTSQAAPREATPAAVEDADSS